MKMMWTCPICKTTNGTYICTSCGFDASMDYMHYRFLCQLSESASKISKPAQHGNNVLMTGTIVNPKEEEKRSNAGAGSFKSSTVKNGFRVTVQNDFLSEEEKREPEEITSEMIKAKKVKKQKKEIDSESSGKYQRVFNDKLESESEWALTVIDEKGKRTKSKIIDLIICMALLGIGIWLAPMFIISIPCLIGGVIGPFLIGEMVFDEWMKESKKKLLPEHDLDNLMKHNPDFARRLYYEKCPEKYLLKYMEKLNPEVVKEIRASGK